SISFDLGTGNRLVELSVTSIGAGVAAYAADELRIGNTFSDVTPVPEPSALLLAGATAGGLVAGRRSAAGRRGLRRPARISATARDPAHFAMELRWDPHRCPRSSSAQSTRSTRPP